MYWACVRETLGGGSEGGGVRALLFRETPACPGPPVPPGPACGLGLCGCPGPGVGSCPQGGCLGQAPALPWWLRSLSRGSVCPKPQEAVWRVPHPLIRWRRFIPACQLPWQGPQETRVPGSLCQVPGCAWRGGALSSALDRGPGQSLARCLRQLCRAGVEGDTPCAGTQSCRARSCPGDRSLAEAGAGAGPQEGLNSVSARSCQPPPHVQAREVRLPHAPRERPAMGPPSVL